MYVKMVEKELGLVDDEKEEPKAEREEEEEDEDVIELDLCKFCNFHVLLF
jgi:hypothetical protein